MTIKNIVNTKEELEQFCSKNYNDINKYLDQCFKDYGKAPLTASVDIRESSSKFAPVDNNLYPAGFNNLCQLDIEASGRSFRKALSSEIDDGKTVGICVESHTKNLFYLDHLVYLAKAVRDAGFRPKLISFDPELFKNGEKTTKLLSAGKSEITIENAAVDNDLDLSLILLNNDQSGGEITDWGRIKVAVYPPPSMGWHRRQKVKHFLHYHEVVQEFSREFKVEAELLEAKYRKIEGLDFNKKENLELLAREVDSLKSQIANAPVFVKASQGTYGMGIMVVNSGAEILEMNRKTRNKMDLGKNKIKFQTILLQEGIETVLRYQGMSAEVSIYLVGGRSVGGFMRANPQRSSNENLNARGMVFKKFCISEIRENQDHKAKESLYSIIARLSTLAAAKEIKAENENESESEHEIAMENLK